MLPAWEPRSGGGIAQHFSMASLLSPAGTSVPRAAGGSQTLQGRTSFGQNPAGVDATEQDGPGPSGGPSQLSSVHDSAGFQSFPSPLINNENRNLSFHTFFVPVGNFSPKAPGLSEHTIISTAGS